MRRIKEETGARILCGIMPFVSLKNATFMKNEMAGIDVTDEVLARYRADMTREEGEQAGVQLAKEVIRVTTGPQTPTAARACPPISGMFPMYIRSTILYKTLTN